MRSRFLGCNNDSPLLVVNAIVTQSCNSLDKLVSLHISNLTVAQHQQQLPAKIQGQLECVSLHFSTHHRTLVAILAQVLNLLVSNENGQGIWSLSRPLLSLMLLLPQEYEKIVQAIIGSQPGPKAEQVRERSKRNFISLTFIRLQLLLPI